MNIHWNAQVYAQNFDFVPRYGESLTDLLTLPAGSTVLDLGCGNGQLTGRLAEKGYAVTGLDASIEMLTLARKTYPALKFMQADAAHFKLHQPVDGIFSNAVFHWINDQSALLRSVAHALKPGGQIVCEFGGKGCAQTIHSALRQIFAEHGLSYRFDFYFPTIGEYAPLMEANGLKVVYAALFDRTTPLSGETGLADWIRMFDQAPFEALSPELTDRIITEAEDRLRPMLYHSGIWTADYVRIRLKAIKIK